MPRCSRTGDAIREVEVLATGVVPRLVEELREREVPIAMDLFRKPAGRDDG